MLDIAVDIAPEDWQRLRAQTRTPADIMGGTDYLAQPITDIVSWFSPP
ncbi:MAG: hypothetical protein OXJ90_27075 [Spirochaetaceae bacterium]|nr:hypothetical protein [Spirochaetaceae bacterium]